MDRQTRTRDTVLSKSREMTGWSRTLSWWRGGGGVKTTENKIHRARVGFEFVSQQPAAFQASIYTVRRVDS
jgi:hypothetical protein